MTEKEELAYEQGQQIVWRRMLRKCITNLAPCFNESADKQFALLLAERSEAIAILRDLCEEFGDNNWDENLHLADIIEKHLGKYLHELKRQDEIIQIIK
jgi:predicted secreted protein